MKAASAPISVKIICVASLGLLGSVAQADIIPFQSNGRTVEVRYGDLDLGKKADQRTLTARINSAAGKVCAARTVRESRSCQLLAIEQVRAPVAAAIARAQSGERYAAASTHSAAKVGE